MRLKGFCFPNSFPADDDAAFQSFRSAPGKDIYNPWPQLVDLNGRQYGCSQPLVAAWYIPSTKPDERIIPPGKSQLTIDWVATYHEYWHLMCRHTPAREWARVCLGSAYRILQKLFDLPDNASDAEVWTLWQKLNLANTRLDQVTERIALAEELMANAITFGDLEREMADRPLDVALVRELEAEAIEKCDIPGFDRLYPGLKRVLSLVVPGAGLYLLPVVLHIAVLLESVQMCGDHLQAIDSEEQCEKFLAGVEGMTNSTKVFQWVIQASQECAPLRLDKLAILPWSDLPERVRIDLPIREGMPVRNWQGPTFLKGFDRYVTALLCPNEVGGRWNISAKFCGSSYLPDYQPEDYLEMLSLEALRQQLDERVGIRCPVMGLSGDCTKPCAALPSFKEKVIRLADRAKSFDRGIRNDVYLPCGQMG